MRIAVVTTSYPRFRGDPAGHFVRSEVELLVRNGARVTVLSPYDVTGDGTGARHVRVAGGDLFGWPGALPRLKARPWRVLQAAGFARSVSATLDRLGPWDRVVAHWIVPSGWPASLASSGELEVVAHGSDVRVLLSLPRPVAMTILRKLLVRGATFRFVSSALLAELGKRFPPIHPVSRVQPCAIDLPVGLTRDSARSLLGLREGRIALVVGRLLPSKRTEVALGAALLVPDARVLVVGDGPELGPLQRRFGEVEFLGRLDRERTLHWLAAADVLISASRQEGAPTTIREARTLGTPVVSCPAGDLSNQEAWDEDLWIAGS